MQALPAGQPRIHVRGRVIKAAPCPRRQADRQLPDGRLVCERHRGPHQATPAVEPHLVG